MHKIHILALSFSLLLMTGSTGAFGDARGGSGEISDIALGILSAANVKTDTDSLIKALASHQDPIVRSIAAETLGARGEKRARPFLLKALKSDADPLVRQDAALALAKMGDAEGLAAAKELMEKTNDPVNKVFLAARLAELGEVAGYKHVCDAARSKSLSLRLAAAQSLVPFLPIGRWDAFCTSGPADLLLSLGEDKDPQVRNMILLFLPGAVQKGLSRESARTLAKRLAESDPDPKVRSQAEAALESLKAQELPGGLR